MKIAKRFLTIGILVIFGMMTVFTGCTSQTTKEDTKTPAQTVEKEDKKKEDKPVKEKKAKTTEVDIFQFKVEVAKELANAAKEYEKTHDNVKINIQTVGGGDDYGAALRAKFQSGNEPDIFNIGGPQDVKDWLEKLEDLSNEPWVDLGLEGILSGVTVDNKIYGLPFNMEGYGFVYNTEIFKDAGIDASKIVDFASLETAVRTLDSKIKAGKLKDKYPLLEAVFEYPTKETWVTGLHTLNAGLSNEFDSSIDAFKSDKVEFKYGDGLKAIIDLQGNYSSNGSSKAKLNAVDYATQVDQGIAIERVAMIQQGNWIYSQVAGVDEEVAKKLDILPMPIKGAKEDCIPVGVPMHWCINKNSKAEDKKAAKDFLNWLYTSDTGKDFVVNKFFFIPPLKGYENLEPKDSLGKAVKRYAEAGKTMPWVFMGYPTGWGMEVFGNEVQKYFAGEVTWDEVISNSQAKWTEMR